jgi:uncharacterized protein (DUF302 family)
MNENGLITIRSKNSVNATVERIEGRLNAGGVTLFARIDHEAGAKSAGMPLRPTQVLIFGNPRAGTPLMQANQTIGIDLPLKITCNDPAWLAKRHNLGPDTLTSVKAIADALANLAAAAAE